MLTIARYSLILNLFFLFSCKKNIATAPTPKDAIYSQYDAFDLQAEGMNLFNTQPEKAAPAFLKAAEAYLQNKMPKDAGICLGLVAHLYQEKFQKPDSALILSQKALDYALQSNDTLNTGHSYSYTGFLTGILGNPDKGIELINKSFPYYEMMRNKDGQAAARYDMARVYGENGKWAEAMSALNESTAHFKEKTNLQRVFNNNVYAMKIFKSTNNSSEYKRVVDENEYLIKTGKINPVLQQKYVDMLEKTK